MNLKSSDRRIDGFGGKIVRNDDFIAAGLRLEAFGEE